MPCARSVILFSVSIVKVRCEMCSENLNVNGRPVAQFPDAESVGSREWGDELLLVLASKKYSMKNANKKV